MIRNTCTMGHTSLNLLLQAAVSLSAWGLAMSSSECGEERLMICSHPLRVITENQDLTFASKREDLHNLCPKMSEGFRCIDKFTRQCMSPRQRAHFNSLYSGTSMVIHEICQEGPYQREFLLHAPCMRSVKEDYDQCAKIYQQQIIALNEMGPSNGSAAVNQAKVQKLCCSFQDYLRCSHSVVNSTCGEETAKFAKHFLDRMASSLNQIHCGKYILREQCTSSSGRCKSSSVLLICLLFLILTSKLVKLRNT